MEYLGESFICIINVDSLHGFVYLTYSIHPVEGCVEIRVDVSGFI